MTTYQGFDVLDETEHNRIEPRPALYRRRFDLYDPRTGARAGDDHAGAPVVGRPFAWFCESRSAVNTMRAFLTARRGRAVPFWVPTFQRDMVLAAEILDGASQVSVRNFGYTRLVFPREGVRRHIRIASPGLATIFREITGALDQGATEQLSLDSPVTPARPITAFISFLTLCRLESDDVDWTWRARDVAEAAFRVVELIQEAP